MAVGGERKIFFCEASVADGSRLANAFLMKDFPAQSPVSNPLGSAAANAATLLSRNGTRPSVPDAR